VERNAASRGKTLGSGFSGLLKRGLGSGNPNREEVLEVLRHLSERRT
jgi:hypothetical protein